MTEYANLNPDAAPKSVPHYPLGAFSLLEACKLALATLGISLLTLTVFGSLVWLGTFSIFALDDQAHVITLMISTGLAVCAFLSQMFERLIGFRYGSGAFFSIVAAAAIAYFFWNSWPIAIGYYYYCDLSKVFACYTSIAFVPALLLSLPAIRARAGAIALASFASLGCLVLYVVLR